jgi:hypothetical protein
MNTSYSCAKKFYILQKPNHDHSAASPYLSFLERAKNAVVMLLLIFLIPALPLMAQQAPNATGAIHVGPSVHVSADLPAEPHGETEMAADPQDANQLVACSMMFPNDSPTSEVATYVSSDGGKTWKLALKTQGQDGHESWDPDCRFGPNHVLYSLSEGSGPDYPDSYNRLDRSTNGGKTWETSTRAIHAERSFIVTDDRPGPQNGWLYLYGLRDDMDTILAGYSTDGGQTFLTQVVPMEKGFHVINIGPGAILSDGSLVFPMPVMKQSWEESQQGHRVRLPAEIQLVRLQFQQANWPLKVETKKIAPWFADFEANGSYYTTLAVDKSEGPFKDRIHVVWEDRSSDRSQVKLSFSSDKGKTWSHPRIMDDNVARQVGDAIHGPDDLHGVVAVNPQGVVGVMWFDRRDFLNNLGWSVRFRASLDGGETFFPSVKVSNMDYDPARGRVYLFGGAEGLAVQSTNTLSIPWFVFHGGHTMGFTADANGGFHPLWIANPTGIPQLWTTDITVDGKVVNNGSPALAKLEDASKLVRLEFLNRYYDPQTHIVDFELRLRNASKGTIRGPLKVRVLDFGSYVGDVMIHQDGKEQSIEGAVWDFTSLLPDGVFQPGYVTKSIHVRLTVRGVDPFTQIGRFPLFITPLATLTTKVLAGSIELSKQPESK